MKLAPQYHSVTPAVCECRLGKHDGQGSPSHGDCSIICRSPPVFLSKDSFTCMIAVSIRYQEGKYPLLLSNKSLPPQSIRTCFDLFFPFCCTHFSNSENSTTLEQSKPPEFLCPAIHSVAHKYRAIQQMVLLFSALTILAMNQL